MSTRPGLHARAHRAFAGLTDIAIADGDQRRTGCAVSRCRFSDPQAQRTLLIASSSPSGPMRRRRLGSQESIECTSSLAARHRI